MKIDKSYASGLETERLEIRPLEDHDAIIWEDFFQDPQSVQYFGNRYQQNPKKNVRAWFQKQMGRYENGTFGLQALINKENQKFIGQCGLATQVVDGDEMVEVGYHILPAHRKKGFASEAAIAFRNLGFITYNLPFIVSLIHCDNVASKAVAINNGMKKYISANYNSLPIEIFRIDRNDWEKSA